MFHFPDFNEPEDFVSFLRTLDRNYGPLVVKESADYRQRRVIYLVAKPGDSGTKGADPLATMFDGGLLDRVTARVLKEGWDPLNVAFEITYSANLIRLLIKNGFTMGSRHKRKKGAPTAFQTACTGVREIELPD
jgi:hypothetical protein